MSVHDETWDKVEKSECAHLRVYKNSFGIWRCPDCGKNQQPTGPCIKDSGTREEFSTGSRRDTREGKGRFDLLPTRALRLLAKHFEEGAKKYGPGNYLKGQPLSRYMDSALRHAFNHLEGQRDEPHLTAAIWNLMALLETQERIKEGMLPKELNDLDNKQ